MSNASTVAETGDKPMRLLFIARSLERGGAERQLTTLLIGLAQLGWPVALACFYAGEALEAEIKAAGVRVFDLHKRGRWDIVGFSWRLMRVVRREKPEVIHGHMPVPNILALLCARLSNPRAKAVWGVRASNMDLWRYDWLHRLSFYLECRLSKWPDVIIANSRAGAKYHIAHGFPSDKCVVIANGIDTARFRFNPAVRRRLRARWGLGEEDIAVGLVARLDPMKDHPTFLRAVSQLCAQPEAPGRFFCIGGGSTEIEGKLRRQAKALGVDDWVHWLGAMNDVAAVYSALDIVVLSSAYGEGFPNVLGEAMACGCPCVVTDVGDSARIVGDDGVVVPPEDPPALAAGIRTLIAQAQRGAINRQNSPGRQRIESRYSLARFVGRTVRALHS